MYILEGAIFEHRDDRDHPVLHEAGGTSKESGGVTHWWGDEGDITVKFVAIDLFNAQPELSHSPVDPMADQAC